MEVSNLKSYLANIDMTLKDFCEIIDADDKHMSKLMHGKANASHRLAKDVRQATGGLIELKVRLRKKDIRKQEQQQKQARSA